MFRATTPKHTFYFRDVDPRTFQVLLITYAQGGSIVMEKHKEDLTFDAQGNIYTASYKLTQEETNKFKSGTVSIQIRALTETGDALASEIKSLKVQEVLDDEVLV